MTLPASHYAGREQAYIKHYLLRTYFSDLIHKIASAYNEIVYVDGFSGPWQSADEQSGDTSFGIALAEMRSAKATWAAKGRSVQMRAMLVERRADAFRELQTLQPKYPDIEIRPYHGEFVRLVPTLLRDMLPNAFAFVFIDPKGWGIPISALVPLLRRPNSEVLFNFMFDFINRAASMSEPAIVDGLNALIQGVGWRDRLASAQPEGGKTLADVRKAVLVDAFSETLANIGRYEFVAETPIFRPHADRTLYSLIYATRKAAGIEVFRRAQLKALREQETVRKGVRQAKASGKQMEAFLPLEMAPSETEAYLAQERAAAKQSLISAAQAGQQGTRYNDIWPTVLAKHAVTKAELNRIAVECRKDGTLEFPDWESGKRVPSDEWLVRSKDLS